MARLALNSALAFLLAFLPACGQSTSPATAGPDATTAADTGAAEAGAPDAGVDTGVDAGIDASPPVDCGAAPLPRVRIMAANITSGSSQSYEDPGIHIFQGLLPDIAMIQEFNYQQGTPRDFVDRAFGPAFSFYRETRAGIPNGVVSRYPILQSGEWADPNVPDRSFVFARIDVPGPIDLWAISVHLKTGSATARDTQAKLLVSYIQANVPAGDYVVVGGDTNVDNEGEAAIASLGAIGVVAPPYPADQLGNSRTNAPRAKPYDWVITSAALDAKRIALQIGCSVYPSGIVFDSRVYTPLADVVPVLATDSAATNMQHMPVAKDFALSE